jgi:hypothetical protein
MIFFDHPEWFTGLGDIGQMAPWLPETINMLHKIPEVSWFPFDQKLFRERREIVCTIEFCEKIKGCKAVKDYLSSAFTGIRFLCNIGNSVVTAGDMGEQSKIYCREKHSCCYKSKGRFKYLSGVCDLPLFKQRHSKPGKKINSTQKSTIKI